MLQTGFHIKQNYDNDELLWQLSYPLYYSWASLVAQTVQNPFVMQETWVRSLDWENPLEEGMATHSSILAWRIPMNRGAWQATVHGVAKSWTRLSNYAHKIMTVIVITIKHHRKINLMKLQATRSYAANNTSPRRSASHVSPPFTHIMTSIA